MAARGHCLGTPFRRMARLLVFLDARLRLQANNVGQTGTTTRVKERSPSSHRGVCRCGEVSMNPDLVRLSAMNRLYDDAADALLAARKTNDFTAFDSLMTKFRNLNRDGSASKKPLPSNS